MKTTQSKYRVQLLNLLKKSAKDKRVLSDVLSVLFTDKEQEEVERRLEILKSLHKGAESQRTIADRVQVSIATVTRQSHVLQTNQKKVEKVLTKL